MVRSLTVNEPPDPLPPALQKAQTLRRYERLTGEVRIPMGALREAPFPKRVVEVSGHNGAGPPADRENGPSEQSPRGVGPGREAVLTHG